MNVGQLALRNIQGNAFRSWVVLICALLVAGFSLATVLIIRGAEDSLRLAMNRLGADVVVVPQGAEVKVENALLMGTPASFWMPAAHIKAISSISGVSVASPQVYLSTLHDVACCAVDDMFLLAYDPATDFTVEPWLESRLGSGLSVGECIGGRDVFVPPGETYIKLYGYDLTLKGNMEPTGTNLDMSMFLTVDTAREMARTSLTLAAEPLEVPVDQVSAVMVKVAPGNDPVRVGQDIARIIPGVTPLVGLGLFDAFRKQISVLQRGMVALLGVTTGLSLLLLGLVFSMVSNERRREIGVLCALGASRSYIFRTLITEAATLAILGGLVGVSLAALVTFLFGNLLVKSLGVPFIYPEPVSLLVLIGAGLGLALACVTVAALLPAFRISRLEAAIAMRE